MGKLLGLRIRNYGVLREVELGRMPDMPGETELTNIVCLIGRSGAGKSTFADALGFIADCLGYGLEAACVARNRFGYERLVSQGAARRDVSFEMLYQDGEDDVPIHYALTIALDEGGRPIVEEERLRQLRDEGPITFMHLRRGMGTAYPGTGGIDEVGREEGDPHTEVTLTDPRRLGIETLGSLRQHPRVVKLKEFLASWYLCYFSPSLAREIPGIGAQPYLDREGRNLNNVAQYMQREDPAAFARVLRDIQAKLPGIAEITPVTLPTGQLVLQFRDDRFAEPFFSQKMSDGTLKLFAYYLLINEMAPRSLVCIEEPENGLYHTYLDDLAHQMKQGAGQGCDKQFFITTHSPFFVNALTPGEVWVIERGEDGFATVKRAADFQLVQELAEEGVPLGDIWYSRYFGE